MTNEPDTNGGGTAAAVERGETLRGRRSGSRYVRIIRPSIDDLVSDEPDYAGDFRSEAPDYLVAEERVLEPQHLLGRGVGLVWRTLVGRRIPTHREIHERLTKVKVLAVFASDNISSSA